MADEYSDETPASDNKDAPETGKKAERVLEIALKRYQMGIEAGDRDLALEDLKFAMGDQWPDKERTKRENAGRPCLTINRVQQMVKQVVNDMRQNRAGVKVLPSGSGATKEIAEIHAGLIRQIEASSDAPDHYISAAEGSVMTGEGYFRILPKYEPDSFDQYLCIERIKNRFSVVMDPCVKLPDGSDAGWGFIVDDMPREEFESQYPDADGEFNEADGRINNDWITKDTVRVAEYYSIEYDEDTLYMLEDGSTVKRSELPAAPPDELVMKSRSIKTPKCVWRKITSTEVLEKTVYKTKYVPIIAVYGEEYDVEGKTVRMGIVRHAKDPQRIYNYSRTSVVEQITLAPKAPFVMAVGQVEGLESYWKTANTENHSYLPYNPVTIAGQAAPAPQRQSFAGVPAGSMADLSLASDEIKAVTGIYDAALGQKSNETSGKAILARQREADNATYHYVDSLNRAIKLCGRQLVDMIPIIYDTERAIRIIGEDGKESMVEINKRIPGSDEKINDLSLGRYDVDISTGPSYETKRIEAVNSMTSFMQAVPDSAPMLADLIAKNMDWPGAEQIARRLQAMLPPEVLKADENGDEVPPAIVAQLNEMGKVIKDLQGALQEQLGLNAELIDKARIEDRKLDIDAYKASTDRMAQIISNMAPEVDPAAIEAVVMSTLQSLLTPIYTPEMEAGNPADMMGQPTAETAGPTLGAMQ